MGPGKRPCRYGVDSHYTADLHKSKYILNIYSFCVPDYVAGSVEALLLVGVPVPVSLAGAKLLPAGGLAGASSATKLALVGPALPAGVLPEAAAAGALPEDTLLCGALLLVAEPSVLSAGLLAGAGGP